MYGNVPTPGFHNLSYESDPMILIKHLSVMSRPIRSQILILRGQMF